MKGPGGLRGESREAPGGWARAPEGGRSLRGGGGGLFPARGTTGAPLERGGGRACIARVGPCRFMAARHGTISATLRAALPFFGGLRGGGGAGGCCVLPPLRGGGCWWELRPAWPIRPGGVPWARGPLRGRTSDSPGGTPLGG